MPGEPASVTTYRRGAKGPEVSKIQTRLKDLDFYAGPIDADFGGGTESSVKSFQKAKGLVVDGQVGPRTWAALFPALPLPQWIEDVRARKLAIATGEGTVHGRYYNLKEQYGIGL